MASEIWSWQPFQDLPSTPDREYGTRYFDYHQTENYTLDKIDLAEMAQNAAAYAVLAWLAAQSPVDFGSGAGLVESAG